MAQANTGNSIEIVTKQPTVSPPSTPQTIVQRKVSIASDVIDNRYDNLAFEPCSKRKTSQVRNNFHFYSVDRPFSLSIEVNNMKSFFGFYFQQSDHSDHHHTLPHRKRSILVNGGQSAHADGESIHSHQSYGNK